MVYAVSQYYIQRKSVYIAGTALLGTMFAVLDWLSKTGWLKIPFPPLTFASSIYSAFP